MKVFLDTIGCRLNQAEIESMASQFRAAGHDIVASAQAADLAVVNTCSVTTAAASDSRSRLRRAAGLGCARVLATGCWATLKPREAAAMPGVSRVVLNVDKASLVSAVLEQAGEKLPGESLPRIPLPGPRRRTRAFVKVQDGCDNRCTFCVTTIARGPDHSRSQADVIADVRIALTGGAQEIVLTGVHLGSWGHDLGLHLRDLIRSILLDTDAPRVRLSSLEPWDLDADFFSLWENRRLCNHLHLPLQSGCAATLRRMARKTTPESFRTLVTAARQAIPAVAITTDVIAGFPGESDAAFRTSLDFVREMEFAGGHAFSYSAMAGTAAARFRDQVPPDARRRRTREYIRTFDESARVFRAGSLGQVRSVLWEDAATTADGHWSHSGLTDNYLRVAAKLEQPRWNMVDRILLTREYGAGLAGIIAKTG